MDLQEWELEAINYGGQMGGEYLDSIKKTDLATLTTTEWQTFLETITINYHIKHRELKPCPF